MSLDTTKPVSRIKYNGVYFVQAGSSNNSSSEIVDGSITTVTGMTIGSATTIRDNAFSGLQITTVEIPASVTTIGDSAFANNNITSLTISEGVQTIGANAFANNNITSLTIPASVTAIGASAFAGCDSLTEITMKGTTPPTIGENALPDSVTSIYVEYGSYNDYVSSWSAYADKIVRLPAKPSTITVTVNNYLDELVSGASVTITGNNQTYTGTTNLVGVFSQGDLQPATYTISVADLEGFKTPNASEVVVEEDTQNSVMFTYLEKPAFTDVDAVFGNNSPAIISLASAEISDNNMTSSQVAENYGWHIGDTISYTLSTGENVEMRIIGFNHDILSDGSGKKAGITLEMVNSLAKRYVMNDIQSTVGGYGASTLKNETLPTIKALIPQEWQTIIKPVNKKSANGSGSSYTETLTLSEDLFLLCTKEVFGNGTNSKDGENEGEWYEYYEINNMDSARIKKYDSDKNGVPETASGWWLRSGDANTYHCACVTSISGKSDKSDVTNERCVSFAFCV